MNQTAIRFALSLSALLAGAAIHAAAHAEAAPQAVTPYADIRYRLELVD